MNSSQLTSAFKALRKQGLVARQNFLCCGGCAGYAIATIISDRIDKGTPKESIKGCVFYHHQDAENMYSKNGMYISFGPVTTSKHGKIGLSAVKVGKMCVKAFTDAGLTVVWNGKDRERILVK